VSISQEVRPHNTVPGNKGLTSNSRKKFQQLVHNVALKHLQQRKWPFSCSTIGSKVSHEINAFKQWIIYMVMKLWDTLSKSVIKMLEILTLSTWSTKTCHYRPSQSRRHLLQKNVGFNPYWTLDSHWFLSAIDCYMCLTIIVIRNKSVQTLFNCL
jgi:hypothetical protein